MTTTLPSPRPEDGQVLPAELRERPQWVGWRLRQRASAPKPTKQPLNPRDGELASTTDPATWGTFEEALKCPGTAGVGFVFTRDDPYVGIDLDGCRNPETGALEKWAADIVAQLASYTEVSPSGTGVHVIVRGSLPGTRRRKGPIEMYAEGRYFTMTGKWLADTPQEIAERTAELNALHEGVFEENAAADDRPKPIHARLTDDELVRRAQSAANGAKFMALWSGDVTGYDSQSEADLALCGLLAFWTGPDQARPGFYRNDRNSHLRGKVGELAAIQVLREMGIPAEPLFEDLARLNEADINASGAFRADVKTWSSQFWEGMGRCVAVGQLPSLAKKADVVIWCVAERELRPGMAVTVAGWNTLSEVRDAPRRWTGPATGRKVDNFQVDESAIRELTLLQTFRV